MIDRCHFGSTLSFFGGAATVVWIAGTHLAIAAEEISDRRKLGKAMMGFIVLAAATELPEIVTTLFAAVTENASLLLNNMFGGIALQTAILSVTDATAVHVSITHYPRKPTPILEGTLLILVLAVLQAIILSATFRLSPKLASPLYCSPDLSVGNYVVKAN